METFLQFCSTFLLFTVGLGLYRVVLGPHPVDRMLSVQMFGTTGVGILLLLSESSGIPALANVALLFALLAVMLSLIFNRRQRRQGAPNAE